MLIRHVLCFLALWPLSLHAQGLVEGSVTDENGEGLPFASVYVKGSTKGTTTNAEGYYQLALAAGDYELVFQYVGYATQQRPLRIAGSSKQRLDVQLQPEALNLQEIVVRPDAEDPAYAIIRKAIAKRKSYRRQVPRYVCDAYVKGKQQLANVPESLMGQDIGDLGGILDSTRKGIVYLSESVSRLYFRQPDDYFEEMRSSKVSGNDNGFSFNQAQAMTFNFYDNTLNFNRDILSPIADNALAYYDYRLVGTFSDDNGHWVNKIAVLPKRDADPVYSGHIYIVEDLWNIHSVDLLLLRKAIKVDVVDSVRFKQVHLPVAEGVWQPFSTIVDFRLGIFGIKIIGEFTAIFSNYDIQPSFDDKVFGPAVLDIQAGANTRSESYWDSIRPMPLTLEEVGDYVKKDSLQSIWRSEAYLDSMDRKNNRFETMMLLTGYTYRQSYKRRSISIDSPISSIQYNTVQGYAADLRIRYRQDYDDINARWLELSPVLNYGLEEGRLRPALKFEMQADRLRRRRFSAEGGIGLQQFNREEPVSALQNTTATYFFRNNYLKIFEKAYGKATYAQDIANGLRLSVSAEFAQRSALLNNTDYSRYYTETRQFTSNDPQRPDNEDSPAFDTHQALLAEANLTWQPGNRYFNYPDRRINIGSPWPVFRLRYIKGIAALGSDVDFDYLALRMSDDLPTGLLGYSQIAAEASTFLNTNQLYFMDWAHFNGNRLLTGRPDRYMDQFYKLGYYSHSTTGSAAQVHWQHHFNGFLLDKIPGVRRLGFSTVLSGKALFVDDFAPYYEAAIGIDNIGWGIFRFFRVDYVWRVEAGGQWKDGFVIGLKIGG